MESKMNSRMKQTQVVQRTDRPKWIKWTGLALLACLVGIMSVTASKDISRAADISGTVIAKSGLNVRSGAGTEKDVVGTLPWGTVVTIQETVETQTEGEWYRIQATVDGKPVAGYVRATYVARGTAGPTAAATLSPTSASTPVPTSAPTQVSTPTPIPSPAAPVTAYRNETTYKPISVSAKTLAATPVYSKAGGARKVVSGQKVTLPKNKTVRVTAEKIVKEKKWFKITFTYKKKNRTGYIRNIYVKMTLQTAVPGAVNSMRKSIRVRPGADTKSGYKKYAGAYIRLVQGAEVTITKDIKKKNVKWYKISFIYREKKQTGYVAAKYVKLVKKKIVKKVAVPILSENDFEKSMTEQGFPDSYKQSLRTLHQKYPYWQFVAYKTGLDWNTAVERESRLGVSLISNYKSSAWKSKEPGAYTVDESGKETWTVYDGSIWVAASQMAVAYYMDPRNFLNERNIFMFESLEYQTRYQTRAGVDTVLSNTPFAGKTFSYTDPDTGAAKTTTYTDAFLAAAQLSGVSPYHLASRVKQEVVVSPTATSRSVSGTDETYPGIYNFYNIGAYSSADPISNGLKWASTPPATGAAYMRPWTDHYRAIVGGAMYIGTSYIGKGQNTGYLQKFNVTPVQTYSHQYMTNVEAAYSEAIKTKAAYGETLNATPIIFSIPVYEKMPDAACVAPQ